MSSSTDLREFDASLVQDATALVEVASRAGVFKLAYYAIVSDVHSKCLAVVKKSVEPAALAGETLVSLVKLLEFASNSNGFDITMYKVVVNVINSLVAYISKTFPDLVVVKEDEEAKEETHGGVVEEEKKN
jgi:Rad3-related DNA helicase